MLRTKVNLFLIATAMLAFISCSKDDDNSGGSDGNNSTNNNNATTINPSDADAISDALILPTAAVKKSGSLPTASDPANAPTLNLFAPIVTTSNGGTSPIRAGYGNAKRKLGGANIQVVGASAHYEIPLQNLPDSAGEISIPIGLPTNVDSGEFQLQMNVYDTEKADYYSQTVSLTLKVLKVGSGVLQISLNWDTPTDQDLHLVEPEGFRIYYADDRSEATGGYLDYDNVDGFGPENIFYESSAPDGAYTVQVHDYDGTTSPNKCIVRVNAGGNVSRQFEVTTQNGDTVTVTRFTKSGNSISFN